MPRGQRNHREKAEESTGRTATIDSLVKEMGKGITNEVVATAPAKAQFLESLEVNSSEEPPTKLAVSGEPLITDVYESLKTGDTNEMEKP